MCRSQANYCGNFNCSLKYSVRSILDLFQGIGTMFAQSPQIAIARVVLIFLGFLLVYLGVKGTLEPLIMVPMGLGMSAVNAGVLFLGENQIGNLIIDPLLSTTDELMTYMQINFLQPIYNLTFSNGLIACLVFMGIGILLFAITTLAKGGFKEAYNTVRQKAYLCASTTSMYTVFGSLYYDLINQKQEATPQIQQEIKEWLSQKPGHHPLAGRIGIRNNCIVILAESLESWVLEREVEGQEITPYLNKLLQDSTTLYAPHVLTQVKGGRSIDAQLLLCAGMLPINSLSLIHI